MKLSYRLTFVLIYGKMNSMKKEYLECGRVCSAHGVRGLIKVEPWCDSPRVLASAKRVFLAAEGGKYRETEVLSASVSGSLVIMKLSEIGSREDAIAYKNALLYLHRSDIPIKPGAILLADMIDLPVIDIDTGRVYGVVTEVEDGVRSRIITVKTESGDVLLPSVPEFVKEIDGDRGIFIKPIPGFFSE